MSELPAVTRRAVRPEDAEFRFALFRASRQPGEDFAGFDRALADQLLRQQFIAQETGYRAVYPGAVHDIVEVADRPAGRIVVDESDSAWTLVDIALMPEARGRGLGTVVLREVCDAADVTGAAVSLTVRTGNPARRLYDRLGFVATAVSEVGTAMVRPAAASQPVLFPDRLRLPISLDVDRLAADLAALGDVDWIRHFVTSNYEGDWDVIPLRGKAGATHPIMTIVSDPTCRDYADAPLLAACPAVRDLLSAFLCPLDSVRLMRLRPGSLIKEHRDHDLGFEHGAVRIHIPILTNPQVDFRLNGIRVALAPGTAWYLRLSDPHSVANRGTTDRVHLVIDARVDPWIDSLFARALAEG